MDNLDPTASVWGTSDLVSTGTEIYPHVSQAQIANNTGYNFYRPFLAATISDEQPSAQGGTLSVSYTDYAYLFAGTYNTFIASSTYHTAFTIDGTALGTASNERLQGSEWSGTQGWHAFALDGSNLDPTDTGAFSAQVWLQQTS
jgi:hypothetical protein